MKRELAESTRPTSRRFTILGHLARNRAITGVFFVSIVVGALIGGLQLPEDISLVRRVIGGAVGGAGVALLMTASRMFG
jgi:hypothetical protein